MFSSIKKKQKKHSHIKSKDMLWSYSGSHEQISTPCASGSLGREQVLNSLKVKLIQPASVGGAKDSH